jgi:hypothetical protein
LNSQMETWRKYRRLERGERRVVLESAAVLLLNWAGLRAVGFQRWKDTLARWSAGPNAKAADGASGIKAAREIARLEAAAARHLLPAASCLERSLTLWFLLRRRGIESDLALGGRKEGGRFEAHAWVEIEGIALDAGGAMTRDFVPFVGALPSLPAVKR